MVHWAVWPRWMLDSSRWMLTHSLVAGDGDGDGVEAAGRRSLSSVADVTGFADDVDEADDSVSAGTMRAEVCAVSAVSPLTSPLTMPPELIAEPDVLDGEALPEDEELPDDEELADCVPLAEPEGVAAAEPPGVIGGMTGVFGDGVPEDGLTGLTVELEPELAVDDALEEESGAGWQFWTLVPATAVVRACIVRACAVRA